MELHESGEMYLESVLVLLKEKGQVRSVDVGEYMGFSKPSVSRAMKILRQEDYVKFDDDGHITLTRKGKRVAEKIYERHVVLSEWLTSIGVAEDVAAEDACKVEHVISDETFDAIKKLMGK